MINISCGILSIDFSFGNANNNRTNRYLVNALQCLRCLETITRPRVQSNFHLCVEGATRDLKKIKCRLRTKRNKTAKGSKPKVRGERQSSASNTCGVLFFLPPFNVNKSSNVLVFPTVGIIELSSLENRSK